MAPFTPHVAEDVFENLPPTVKQLLTPSDVAAEGEAQSFFQLGWLSEHDEWNQPELAARWETVMQVRNQVLKQLEVARNNASNKYVGHRALAAAAARDAAMVQLADCDHENRLVKGDLHVIGGAHLAGAAARVPSTQERTHRQASSLDLWSVGRRIGRYVRIRANSLCAPFQLQHLTRPLAPPCWLDGDAFAVHVAPSSKAKCVRCWLSRAEEHICEVCD